MQPRTLVIVAVVLLVGALGLRFLVFHFGWLPLTEEIVLKKAIALRVDYQVVDTTGAIVGKALVIDDPAEVEEALAALRMKDDDNEYINGFGRAKTPRFGAGMAPAITDVEIEFRFNDSGLARKHTFEGPRRLGGN